MAYPNPHQMLEPDGSCEEAINAAYAGLSVVEICQLGISPIRFRCDEAWKPILDRIEITFGYCYEWLPDNPDEVPEPWRNRWGTVHLKKVERR